MPRSMARLSAAVALYSSSYMRKRLPQPKASMETFAFVRPSMREGRAETPGGCTSPRAGRRDKLRPAVVRPTLSRNLLRERSSTGHLHREMIVALRKVRDEGQVKILLVGLRSEF